MDIYEIADMYGNADYYDWATGRIYKIQEYNHNRVLDPDAKIRVTDTEGNTIGYAKKREEQ